MNMHTFDAHLNPDTNSIKQDYTKLKSNLRDAKNSMLAMANDAKNAVKNALDHSLKRVKRKSIRVQARVVSRIKEKPLVTIGIATIAGLISAKLFHK